jgi:hypothetical protein
MERRRGVRSVLNNELCYVGRYEKDLSRKME